MRNLFWIWLIALCFLLSIGQTIFSQFLKSLPDLVVEISIPSKAKAGEDIGKKIKMTVKNLGSSHAAGTIGEIDPSNGYMIDYIFSTDEIVPNTFAKYSPNFSEDVLLGNGRRSRTLDLAPSESYQYLNGAVIPMDAPTGKYFICAKIDPFDKVKEKSEENNVRCVSIEIENPNSNYQN